MKDEGEPGAVRTQVTQSVQDFILPPSSFILPSSLPSHSLPLVPASGGGIFNRTPIGKIVGLISRSRLAS